jgi:hypothetical protein
MLIEVSSDEFLALVWALQLTTANAAENPEQYQNTSHLVKRVSDLNQRLVPQIFNVMSNPDDSQAGRIVIA